MPIPLGVYYSLRGGNVHFENSDNSEISILFHIDNCALMSTVNMLLHEWIVIKYPYLIANYFQYGDKEPPKPFKKLCDVSYFDIFEAYHVNLPLVSILHPIFL